MVILRRYGCVSGDFAREISVRHAILLNHSAKNFNSQSKIEVERLRHSNFDLIINKLLTIIDRKIIF
jgi:hypothetical protein